MWAASGLPVEFVNGAWFADEYLFRSVGNLDAVRAAGGVKTPADNVLRDRFLKQCAALDFAARLVLYDFPLLAPALALYSSPDEIVKWARHTREGLLPGPMCPQCRKTPPAVPVSVIDYWMYGGAHRRAFQPATSWIGMCRLCHYRTKGTVL